MLMIILIIQMLLETIHLPMVHHLELKNNPKEHSET